MHLITQVVWKHNDFMLGTIHIHIGTHKATIFQHVELGIGIMS